MRRFQKPRPFPRILALLSACCLALLSLLPALPFAAASEGTASISHDPTGRGIGFDTVLYDSSNGLPTSEANAIVQSPDGFIWIGGYSGLIRYDGNEFYRYGTASHIASVVSLFIDSRGRLWIGTNDSGVSFFTDDQFTSYGKADGLRSSSIRSIAEDENGNILIATTQGLAYVDPEDALHLIDNPQTNNEYVCELETGPDGTVYGVTLSGNILTVRSLQVTAVYSGSDMGVEFINTVYPDPERAGWVYLGTQTGKVVHGELSSGMQNVSVFSTEPLKTVNCIRKLEGRIWISSDEGIGYLSEDGSFVVLTDLPMTNSIDHILQDYEKNLWFTSSRQGVMKIVQNRFVNLSKLARLDPLVVNSTCLDGDLLYLGTDTGLHILLPDGESVENELTDLLDETRIRCIKKTSDGDLWFCTYGPRGLVRFRPSTGETVQFNEHTGLSSSRVRTLLELSDGNLAVATNGGLNVIRKDGTVVTTYDSRNGITNLEILCVEEGENGVLYIGSDGAGIYRADGSSVSFIGTGNGLRSEVILRIKKDPYEDFFWVITSNSIATMKDGVCTTLEHFPYSNNFDLFFDRFERVWVLSSGGVYVLKRSDMLTDPENPEFTLFTSVTGLPGIATANSYSELAEDGTLYVAASTGVYSVNVNEGTGNESDVRLSIPYVQMDGQTVWIKDRAEITVPAGCKRLTICANAFTYALSNPHLSFHLEGFDDARTETTKQDLVAPTYTNLKGGSYTFSFSILNEVTGETVKTISLKILKEKAFYETVWFYLLAGAGVILLTLLAAFLIYRRKAKAFLKKQEADRRLINEMTKVFSSCVDMKDAYTNGHSARVAKYTVMLARELGKPEEEVERLYNIALLHDIGKISIPDSILNKTERLTDEEYQVMKTHSSRGYSILKDITIAPDIALGAGFHHERYDGKGYPRGLAGDQIPEIAQIIAVADTFDAMYSTRPYRKQLPLETVVNEIRKCSGTQLSPVVVEAFLRLVERGEFPGENDPPPETSTVDPPVPETPAS
ncbi:MAG: HD domain-containing protein [Clostridia bacterium]|nr:HD domain-containing protein [Clostridia bacterium]